MASAQFEYLVFVQNWPSGVLEILVLDSLINRVIIEKFYIEEEWKQTELPLKIRTFLSSVTTYEEARRASDEFADTLLTVIAFVGEFLVSNLLFQHGQLDNQTFEGGATGLVSNTVMFVGRPDIPHIGKDLEDHLKKCDGVAQNYYAMFLAAMRASGVGRYLLLYLILLTHFNDQQKDVDNFIRREEIEIAETLQPTFRPSGPRIMETVYTRLRNELGHRRPGVSQVITAQEVEQHTPGLIVLTKKMIEQL